jgi:putative toxin-antitoxin system antitoxin component (TIGR02293 family)
MSYFYGQMSKIEEKKNKTLKDTLILLDEEIGVLGKLWNQQADEFKIYDNLNFKRFLSDKMVLIQFIQNGVPYSLFELIEDYTPFETEDWVRLLDISSKTLLRHKQDNRKFKPIQSEKIIEMAEVTHAGLEVFGTMEKLRLWLDTPNFALGKSKPIDLLKDSYGKDLVLTELNNINHGILA